MRKMHIIGIMTFAAAILFGCSSKNYTIDDSGKTQHLALDSVFTISLEGNPTTGYLWTDTTELNTCLVQLNKGEEYEMNPKSNQPIGGGGTYTFKYKVKSAGEADLKLVYSRPWLQNTPPVKVFTMKIIAGTMGRIEAD